MAGDTANVVSTPAPSTDPPRPRPRPASTPFNPTPSDVDYSSAGAPILDDIVNLYTPADPGQPKLQVGSGNSTTARRVSANPLPSDPVVIIEGQVPRTLPPRRLPSHETIAPRRRFKRLGDDYEDDSDSDSEVVDRRRRRNRPQQPLVPTIGDSTHVIELAAYVLSGVMLIFLFESFIAIGASMRVSSYY